MSMSMWTADSDLDYNDYFNPKEPEVDEDEVAEEEEPEPTEAQRDEWLREEAGDRAYDAMRDDEDREAA